MLSLQVEGDEGAKTPKFDFSGWNPEAPAGLQFLGLLPVGSQGYEIKYPQDEHTGKIKASAVRRRSRQRQQLSSCIRGRTLGNRSRCIGQLHT